jgi:glycosyltransferase involved in cell wall biosynthesis
VGKLAVDLPNLKAGSMRIAQVAPLHEAVPPALYGGTERVVSFLTEELVALGHDVTLFASGDSCTRAKLAPAWPRALRLDPGIRDTTVPHMLLMEQVRRRTAEFDILHFHVDYWPFSLFTRQATPFLTTLHGRLDLPEIRPIFHRFRGASLVSISDSQRAGLPDADYVATVHHGLPTGLLSPVPGLTPTYLAFLGRIAPEKGPDRAIRIARAAGIPLKIAAKVSDADKSWFDAVIRPMAAAGGVELVGEISDEQKPAFLSGAVGLLMPVDWPEPFGLAMIEAMACGTPVVAFDRGSIPEVVDQGVTGFVVKDEAGAVAAVRRLRSLSRVLVRERFAERFTARRMAEDYVSIYRKLAVGRVPMPHDLRPHNHAARPPTAAGAYRDRAQLARIIGQEASAAAGESLAARAGD